MLEQVARLLHTLAHLAPVTHTHAHVGQHLGDLTAQDPEFVFIRFLRDRETDIRLGDRVSAVRRGNCRQLALGVALYRDYRVYGDVYAEIVAVDCGGDRVDEKRHVVVDHLDERVIGRVAVLFLVRVEDAQQCLAGAAHQSEFEVIERNSRHDLLGASLEILVGYVREVLCEECPDFSSVLECARGDSRGENSVDYALPGIAAAPIRSCCHCECPGGYSRPESRDFSLQCSALYTVWNAKHEKKRAGKIHPLGPVP